MPLPEKTEPEIYFYKIITGAIQPTQGSIYFEGKKIEKIPLLFLESGNCGNLSRVQFVSGVNR